jgi:hypothetical protein
MTPRTRAIAYVVVVTLRTGQFERLPDAGPDGYALLVELLPQPAT